MHLHPAPQQQTLIALLAAEDADILLVTLRTKSFKLFKRGARFTHLQAAHDDLRGIMNTAGDNASVKGHAHPDAEGESDVFFATSKSSIGSSLSDVTFRSKSPSVTTLL